MKYLCLFLLLLLPSSASALTFQITNDSGRPDNKVFVNVTGSPGQYDVPGMTNNVPVALSSIPNNQLTINQLVSGRIYISYGQGVPQSVPFNSPIRFDWAELTVTPSSADVANLTAVDAFGIGMRLRTYDTKKKLEEIGTANSNTVFNALKEIPGGKQAIVRNSSGGIVRILSPNKTDVYPTLEAYVKSLAGKKITLYTAFYGSPFVTSQYSGTFEKDGSITLTGSSNPSGYAPTVLSFEGSQIIEDIYTGGNTPNNLSGAIYRDLLAGFSTGLWGGKYGNNALDFCLNPIINTQGSWCPNGFNKPAFGDARKTFASFISCEQYAAVINKYSDSYGNPYSDASKKTTVSLDQPANGGNVKRLELVIQKDSGNAMPIKSGNSNCQKSNLKISFAKKIFYKNQKAYTAKVFCPTDCRNTKLIIRKNNKLVAKGFIAKSINRAFIFTRLTAYGKHLPKKFKAFATIIVHSDQKVIRKNQAVLVQKS